MLQHKNIAELRMKTEDEKIMKENTAKPLFVHQDYVDHSEQT